MVDFIMMHGDAQGSLLSFQNLLFQLEPRLGKTLRVPDLIIRFPLARRREPGEAAQGSQIGPDLRAGPERVRLPDLRRQQRLLHGQRVEEAVRVRN